MSDENDYRAGDLEYTLLRKILARLGGVGIVAVGPIALDFSDVEIGAVELKDATTDTRVKVTGAAPGAGDNGVVTRNIPSGTQAVSGPLTDAELRATPVPVSGTVAVSSVAGSIVVASVSTPVEVQQGSNNISIDKFWYVGITDGINVLGTVANKLKVDGSGVTQPVSGTVTAVGPLTDAQLRASAVPVSGTGTFAVQDSQTVVDNATFTQDVARVFPIGMILDETGATALTEDDIAAPRIDAKRAQVLVIEDATTRGQRATVDSTGAIKILPFVRGTLTDKSGSIAVAATSQTVAASNASRNYFFFQNLSPSPMWINFTTAAVQTQPSIRIDSGAVFEMTGTYITTESVLVIAPTAAAIFTAKEG